MRRIAVALVGALVIWGVAVKSAAQNNAKSGFVDIDVVKQDDTSVPGEVVDMPVPGVEIKVDGKRIGETPITGHRIDIPSASKAREIRVEAKMEGYSTATKAITIKPNDLVKLSFKLIPTQPQATRVTTFVINQDQGTVVVVIDRSLGNDTIVSVDDSAFPIDESNDPAKGSLKISNLAVGRHEVFATNGQLKHRCGVDLKKGETWILLANREGITILGVEPPRAAACRPTAARRAGRGSLARRGAPVR